jgi:formylglycine-generating enzyme required for sulfatase activity
LHAAEITQAYQISKYAVTTELYALFDQGQAARFKNYKKHSPSSQCPSIYLNWYDGWSVTTWLHSRLPDEYEWEYACRAQRWEAGAEPPAPMPWCFGNEEQRLTEYAWYLVNSAESKESGRPRAYEVGRKAPNDFGLYDMHGNVWEWTSSWYFMNVQEGRDASSVSRSRVLRGGSFSVSRVDVCRSACRSLGRPAHGSPDTGVRAARAS